MKSILCLFYFAYLMNVESHKWDRVNIKLPREYFDFQNNHLLVTDVSGRHPGKEKCVFSVHFVLHNWEFYSALLGIPCPAFLYTHLKFTIKRQKISEGLLLIKNLNKKSLVILKQLWLAHNWYHYCARLLPTLGGQSWPTFLKCIWIPGPILGCYCNLRYIPKCKYQK